MGEPEIVFISTVGSKIFQFCTAETIANYRIPIQGSCGASLNGEFWIIGGWNEGRQVFTTVDRIKI